MFKNFARLLPVVTLALAAALPTPVSAAGGGGGGTGMTLTIGSGTLQDRILVTVPVTVQCSAPLADQPIGFAFVNVNVQQAVGTSIAHGSGGVTLSSCPSAPMTVLVPVTPDLYPTPSAPFHGGPAIVSAFAQASDTTFTIFEGGSAGPASVRI